MEALRLLKREIRKHPGLMALVEQPSIRATVALRRLRMRHCYGSHRRAVDVMNVWIHERIVSKTPSAIGKLGTLEVELLSYDRRRARGGRRRSIPSELRRQAFVNVGLFPPTDDLLWKALDTIRASLGDLDGMGVNGKFGEHMLVRDDCRNVKALSETGALEPWRSRFPWSAALREKRVLVVHPFSHTIASQFRQARPSIWKARPEILPDFDLATLQMPLSAGLVPPDEPDWLTRLDRIRSEMDRRRFDVAIIGAGGMSLPLAAHAKASGAIGFHMGGATQLLFGIRGRRWDEHEDLKPFYSDAWVRPSRQETPVTVRHVENGCYW